MTMETKSYKLEEIAQSFYYGSMPQEKLIRDSGYPIFTGYRYTGYYSEYNIPRRSIVVVARGVGGTGDVRIAEEKTFLTNLSIAVDIDTSIVDIDYLKYYLNIQGLRYLDSGAAQSQITINSLKRHRVFLPELKAQKSIVAVLSAYDNLIEANNKRIKVLEQMAENLYKEWFVRFRFPGHETAEFENGIPKGWAYRRADEIIDFNPTLKTGNQTEFTIIPMEALSTNSMVLDSSCFVRQDSISGRRSQNGDTLLAKITPCLENGKTGFVMGMSENEVLGGSTEFVVMRSKALTPHYVYCIARSEYFRQTAILSMNGADGRQRVDEDKLKSTKILQPEKTVLARFETMITPIFDGVYQMIEENKNLTKQRDLLLPRLMSGKLEV